MPPPPSEPAPDPIGDATYREFVALVHRSGSLVVAAQEFTADGGDPAIVRRAIDHDELLDASTDGTTERLREAFPGAHQEAARQRTLAELRWLNFYVNQSEQLSPSHVAALDRDYLNALAWAERDRESGTLTADAREAVEEAITAGTMYRATIRRTVRIRVEQRAARRAIESFPFPTAEAKRQVAVGMFGAADAWAPIHDALAAAERERLGRRRIDPPSTGTRAPEPVRPPTR